MDTATLLGAYTAGILVGAVLAIAALHDRFRPRT